MRAMIVVAGGRRARTRPRPSITVVVAVAATLTVRVFVAAPIVVASAVVVAPRRVAIAAIALVRHVDDCLQWQKLLGDHESRRQRLAQPALGYGVDVVRKNLCVERIAAHTTMKYVALALLLALACATADDTIVLPSLHKGTGPAVVQFMLSADKT